MPKGIYPRKNKKKIAKEVKKLIIKRKSLTKRLTMHVLYHEDGLCKDIFKLRNLTDIFGILVNHYIAVGIVIEEIRIV